MSSRFGIGLLVLLLLSFAGCGSTGADPGPAPGSSDEAALSQIGEMLRDYQLINGSPPRSLEQLQANAGASLGGAELLSSDRFVIIWGATLPDTNEQPGSSPDQDVLAYSKDANDNGGAVLLLNRTVRTMTTDEFQAAPKAQSSVQ